MIILRLAFVLLALLLPLNSLAGTYYISTTGNDTNSGTSTLLPWKHSPGDSDATGVAASSALNPGDTVVFRGGDVWTNHITTARSGSAVGGYIKYISGHLVNPQWGTSPAVFDGVSTSSSSFTTTKRGMFTANESTYIWIEGFEFYGIKLASGDNNAAIALVRGAGSSNNVAVRNIVHDCESGGILVYGMSSWAGGTPGYSSILNNTISNCSYHGVKVYGSSRDITISGNTIHDNGLRIGDGIGVFDFNGAAWPYNISITSNSIYNHLTKGAIIFECATDAVISHNMITGSNRFGIALSPEAVSPQPATSNVFIHHNVLSLRHDLEGAIRINAPNAVGWVTGVRIINNTLMSLTGSASGGVVWLNGASSSTVSNVWVTNNIVVVNNGGSALPCISVTASATNGFYSNNNLLWNMSGASPTFALAGSTKTYAQWVANGYDSASIVSDPLLCADFRLGLGSPAISSGATQAILGIVELVDIVGTPITDAAGVPLVSFLSMGAYQYLPPAAPFGSTMSRRILRR